MPILRQPVSSITQYAMRVLAFVLALICLKCACYSQLEILQKIESLGGSAGYDLNPDAFTDFVPVGQRTI